MKKLMLRVIFFYQSISLCAASSIPSEIIIPNLQQQGIPSIKREELNPNKELPEKNSQTESGSEFADQVLPSAIRSVELRSQRFTNEINSLLSQFIGKDRLSGKKLGEVRGEIWNLYRQHGILTRVELSAIPHIEADKGSILLVSIEEIRIRSISVEQENSAQLQQNLLDGFLADAKADLSTGGILNLDDMERFIQRRAYLKDLSIRANLIPVDTDYVDVQFLVSNPPFEKLGWLLQYDSNGVMTTGRDRYSLAVSIPGRLLRGDQFDLLALKSAGMSYGRIAYEFPFIGLRSRLNMWASDVGYRMPPLTKGNTTSLGAGLNYLFHIDNQSIWNIYLNLIRKHQADFFTNETPTANKNTNIVQLKIDTQYALDANRSLRANAALTRGNLNLSALPSAELQDSASTNAAGNFTKFEWRAAWHTHVGYSGRWDASLDANGQFSNKNLDQSEKFALGGPFAIRAYGSSEALGDEGYVVRTDLGYTPTNGFRLFTFYDSGRIHLNKQSWGVQNLPPSYKLRGVGVGFSYFYKSLNSSVTYGRQIGDNPGLFSTGLDAEGVKNRDRLWVSLTCQF
ncbi:ShlB/FhaC/HecB family hemolysin secretion/activation protein [Undibacterium sp. SXout11W]|uniref:ShlB/FhaC/HecB family hemolysin secretion/activation protein n=1 Tax=Undibacterium sp. SXout11W TaxID=3413050 RepID=UPI003BF105D6